MDLQKWMDKEGATDQALADQIGLTRGYISRIRRGLVHTSLGTALELQALTRGEIPIEMFLPVRLRAQTKRKIKLATQPKPRPPKPNPTPRPTPTSPPPAARKRGNKKATEAIAAAA